VGIINYMPSQGADLSWRRVAAMKLRSFLCPTDPNTRVPFALNPTPGFNTAWARGNYGACGGASWLNWTTHGKSYDGGARDAIGSVKGFSGGVFGVNYGARVAEIVSQDG